MPRAQAGRLLAHDWSSAAPSDLVQQRVLRRVLTDVANELRDKGVLDEEESFIDATFAMAKGRGRGDRPDQAWKRHENHGDCGSPRLAAVGEHARGKSS